MSPSQIEEDSEGDNEENCYYSIPPTTPPVMAARGGKALP
jgi:hypothetical protein